jgi:hypothetical protein
MVLGHETTHSPPGRPDGGTARPRRRTPRWLRPLLLVAAGLLAACEAVPRTTIDAEDDSVFFPTGRISWDLTSDAPVQPPGEAQQVRARTRTLLDIDFAYGSGESTQQVRAGQIVQVGSVSFPGPGPVDVSADLWNADLSGRLERRWPSGLGLGGRLGLRLSELDITLRSGSPYLNTSNSADLTSMGLLAGVEAFYEPVDRLRLYLGGSLSWGLELSGVASGYEDITINTLDLGAAWTLGKSVTLAGGWRRLDYEADSVDDFLSDIELALAGPFLGLWLRF